MAAGCRLDVAGGGGASAGVGAEKKAGPRPAWGGAGRAPSASERLSLVSSHTARKLVC